ncbi:MAG: hypothetical protein NC453_18650 [Muribaculum sp.]|nr:hypothetical protein [Muribaculum sp.]
MVIIQVVLDRLVVARVIHLAQVQHPHQDVRAARLHVHQVVEAAVVEAVQVAVRALVGVAVAVVVAAVVAAAVQVAVRVPAAVDAAVHVVQHVQVNVKVVVVQDVLESVEAHHVVESVQMFAIEASVMEAVKALANLLAKGHVSIHVTSLANIEVNNFYGRNQTRIPKLAI